MAKMDFKQTIERTKSLVVDLAKLRNVEPAAIANWANDAFQQGGSNFAGRLAVVLLSTYFLANVSALVVERFIPDPPPIRSSRIGFQSKRPKLLEDYNVIFARNLFNSKGLIPGDDETSPIADQGGAPIRTTLPINLTGTMILADEFKSIAMIEDKSNSIIYPVRVEDEIPARAKIIKIEIRKVTFLNTASGRREYVDMPEEQTPGGPHLSIQAKGGPGIEQTSPTQYNLSRSEVDKTLADLNNVLTQARAVPNFENGLPSGYKLFQIVPGSIYDKLGLKNGDVIMGIGGETINDPGIAFQKLADLKTASRMELQVKKDGRPMTLTYDIH